MDDTYVERKRNEVDTLFDVLSPYHPNVNFTLEQNPKRFLDAQIIKENNQIKIQVSKIYVSNLLVVDRRSSISIQEESNKW